MSDDEFEVKRDDIQAALNELAKMIDGATPDDCGFALLVFPFGEGGGMFYISNADRTTMTEAMQEFVREQKARGG